MDKQIYVYRDGSNGKFEIIEHEKIIFFRNEKDLGEPLVIYKYADDNNMGTTFSRTNTGFHKIFKPYHSYRLVCSQMIYLVEIPIIDKTCYDHIPTDLPLYFESDKCPTKEDVLKVLNKYREHDVNNHWLLVIKTVNSANIWPYVDKEYPIDSTYVNVDGCGDYKLSIQIVNPIKI